MDDTPQPDEASPPPATDAGDDARVEVETAHQHPPRRRSWRGKVLGIVLGILIIPAIVVALWVWITLGWVYAKGDRAGYVQKISKKGWLCKTWEGELAMANLPGTMPQIFAFTVRNDSVAELIEQYAGKQVSLSYEQHRGVPTSCFGETEYYVTAVKPMAP
jgi:hypothetical protein